MMSRSFPYRFISLIVASLLSTQVNVWADSSAPAAPPSTVHHAQSANDDSIESMNKQFSDFWLARNKSMLNNLKPKLNLQPDQKKAWDSWSGAITDVAKAQLKNITELHQKHMEVGGLDAADKSKLTTPQRMSRGIEHLQIEIKKLQAHIDQLQLAQSSTQQFYEALDTNQKTIFDLYWQKTYGSDWRRMVGGSSAVW
jgi:hypothetical protein